MNPKQNIESFSKIDINKMIPDQSKLSEFESQINLINQNIEDMT